MWHNKVMKKLFEKLFVVSIYLFCIFILTELSFNYYSIKCLLPIKNANSYGYLTRKNLKTIIPLNKYSSRLQAQLALPFEAVKSNYYNNKKLNKALSNKSKLYGYKDEREKLVIDYSYIEANNFETEFAIVAVNQNNIKKYGTINKDGSWITQPKYDLICPLGNYYTKACIDKNHCGMLDKYGLEITSMTYKVDSLCDDESCLTEFCNIGKNQKS